MNNNFLKKGKSYNLCRKISMIGLGSLIALTLNGCYFLPDEEEVLAPPLIDTPKITFTTIEAKKGNIEKKISVSGTMTSSHLENLFFKFRGGTLKSIGVSLGDKVKKGQLIAELDSDSISSQIKQQEISVRIIELRYKEIKENLEATEYQLEEAKLNLESAKLKLAEMKNEYNKAKLYSTISGEVVYIDSANAGDYVSANKTLVTIADPSKLLVQYKGDDSNNFQQGVAVEIKYKNQVYKGEVVASPYELPLDASKELKKSVYFKVDNLPKEAEIGESVGVVLVLEKKENVIVIPRSLVNNYSGRSYVQVLENGMKYERDVEIGLQTPTEVEIVKGLNEGDKIIQR